MGYDIIGDVHGHAEALERLLVRLGYVHKDGAWRHPERTAIFVGDFIDRGPGQLDVLRMVRPMIDAGSALAVMGNHEFNAIAFATPDPAGSDAWLRPRNAKNRHQHEAFLAEVGEDTPLHHEWIDWFMELPLWIETPEFRVVHACWHAPSVAELAPRLRPGQRLDLDLVAAASRKGTSAYAAVETLLKGPEITLPDGLGFVDKDGHTRHQMRIKWWATEARTYKDLFMGPPGVLIPDIPVTYLEAVTAPYRPVFIGHYWMPPSAGITLLAPRVACVDFSVAKGGPLVAYCYDGEPVLDATKFVSA